MCHTVKTVAFCAKCKTPRDKEYFPDVEDKTNCQDVEDGNDCEGKTSETKESFATVCDDCELSSDDNESYSYGPTPLKNPRN
ncbi:hypothetical protein FGLOB1_2278 [Fusarium globosum]|uniref:Uncharacterized protein n=1 Tax=Fusarium globosum TaxID=78864 RepID=A0A8H5YQR4_9HYPO|nr:hypothetical protein FGLOB1_2278 [Fusarium globosum]